MAKGKPSAATDVRASGDVHGLVKGFHGVRYQVSDVSRAVAFYTDHLGFELEHQQLPAFASVRLGELPLLLSGPGASGSRPLPTESSFASPTCRPASND
jgi:catechol 2,3-dioxygenase-like lactoylglutathione lyase family enzyme